MHLLHRMDALQMALMLLWPIQRPCTFLDGQQSQNKSMEDKGPLTLYSLVGIFRK